MRSPIQRNTVSPDRTFSKTNAPNQTKRTAFKISCLMGKLHTRDVLGNHLKDRSFCLVHWWSITLFLRKTSQESINLERKSYLDCSLDTLCTRGEFGRVTYWLQTLRSWRRWTHRKSTHKDSMRKR